MRAAPFLLLLTLALSHAQLNQIPTRPSLPLDWPKLPERHGSVVVAGSDYAGSDPNTGKNRFLPLEIPSFVGNVAYIAPNAAGFTIAIRPDGQILWWGDPWHEAAGVGFERGVSAVTAVSPTNKLFDGTITRDPPLSRFDGSLWDPPSLAWLSALHREIVQIEPSSTVLDQNGFVSQVTPSLPHRPGALERLAAGIQVTPKPSNLIDVVQIESTGFFTAALKRDGSVLVWGFFLVPSNAPNAVPVPGYEGGDLYYRSASDLMNETFPNGLTNVVQISAPQSYRHLLALKADGTVTALGYAVTAFDTSPDGGWTVYRWTPATNSIPSGLSNVVRIQAGNYFNAAIRANGTLTAWPSTIHTNGTPIVLTTFSNAISSARDVVKVAIGNQHAAILKTDGTVSSLWAAEGLGIEDEIPQRTNTGTWANVVDIAASHNATYGVVLPATRLSLGSASDGTFGIATNRFTFPTAVVGVPQKVHPFTVRNTGALLTTFSAGLSGQAAQDFQIVGISGDIVLQPGASTSIQVRFAPTTAGANKAAQLKVAGNSAESVIELRGDALSPQTGTNGVSPALRHIFRDFNVDLDHATQGPELLSSLGLYTPLSIRDLNFGARMIQKSGSNAIVELRLQTTDDLAKTPFTDYQRITNSVLMPGNKGFLRLRASDN
jgi:alpha-tubulin suppressor-like RCC1 family protein